MRLKRSEKLLAALVIPLFLTMGGLGIIWLIGVIHWSRTGLERWAMVHPPPVPALARIPWRRNWRHPERRRLFPATLPDFRRFAQIPYWWGRGGPLPKEPLLVQLCRSSRAPSHGLQRRAFTMFKRMFRRRQWLQINRFRAIWLPALLHAGRYRLVGRICRYTILNQPANTGLVQWMLLIRAQCFLARNQPDRALVEAVRLFDVCTMRYTGVALQLEAQCLRQGAGPAPAAAPGSRNPSGKIFTRARQPRHKEAKDHLPSGISPLGRALRCVVRALRAVPARAAQWWRQTTGAGGRVDQFIAQQVQGAKIVDALRRHPPLPRDFADLSAPCKVPPVMATALPASIRIPASAYLGRAAHMTGEDFYSLTGRGNLYLLAHKPQLAAAMFTRAYELASRWQIAQAEEDLARTLKAWYQTIGPANQWVRYVNARPGGRTHGH